MENANAGLWRSTQCQNLIRYVPSGIYFARFKAGGKLIRKSLKTTKITTAKLLLNDLIKAERAKHEASQVKISGLLSVGDLLRQYEQRIDLDASLKPNSKKYRKDTLIFLKRSWPELENMDARKVTDHDCAVWLQKFKQSYAPSVVNNTIGSLRVLFNEAVRLGLRYKNPAATLKKVKIKPTDLKLPSKAQFAKFVEAIRTSGAGQAHHCADLVAFLAFTGLRIGEAIHVTWEDIDFQKGHLIVRGSPHTGTKNNEIRFVPLNPPCKELLRKLRDQRKEEPKASPVMKVHECQKSMDRAAKIAGMKRITHHDLRHYFATICIESGVDVPTVSRWLEHFK